MAAAGDETELEPGQRVLIVPELPNGSLQESITLPASHVYPVPAAMPLADAAVLHIAYQTAYVALHHRAGLRAGEMVLITGAAGGVGTAAVQLTVAAGARVIAVVTGPVKAAAARQLGAHEVIDLSSSTDPVGQVRAVTGGRGANVIVDVVGGEAFSWVRRCVAFEGRVVLTGFTSGAFGEIAANHVLLRNYSVVGLHLALYRRENPALLRDVHEQLLGLYEAGAIRPQLYRELPFDQAPAGLDLLASREVIGRVVLSC